MNTSFRLKDDWKPVGANKSAKKLADWMNAISNQFNNAEIVTGGTINASNVGLRLEVDSGSSFPWSKLAFGYALDKNIDDPEDPYTECTINPGSVHVHGITDIEFDGGSKVLTGSPCMIYLTYDRPNGAATLEVTNKDPVSDEWPRSNGSTVKIPLYIFGGTEVTPDVGDAYLVYALTRICNMGDINFDTPIK